MSDYNSLPDYHQIYFPLQDIYSDGENEVFEKLKRTGIDFSVNHAVHQKNLIVFPSEFRHDLSANHDRNLKLIRVPGTSALKTISSGKIKYSNETFTIFEIDEGLDVAYIKDEFFFKKHDVVSKVYGFFRNTPVVLTTDEAEYADYKAHGVSVEYPRDFILVNKDIVKRGRILGNNVLLEHLVKNSCLEIHKARNLLGMDLFIHQFIEFNTPKKPLYAHVTADFKYNRENTEIIDWDNPRVELIRFPKDNLVYRIGNQFLNKLANVEPRRIEQYIAVQYGLLDPNILLAFICGGFGSGKTLLAYSTAIELILCYDKDVRGKRRLRTPEEKEGFYKRIAIFRPNDPIGGKRRDDGTLPGNLWLKTRYRFGGFISAHEDGCKILFPFEEMLRHPHRANDDNPVRKDNLKIGEGYLPRNNEAIKLYSFADIQGSNFEDTIVIIDEAQNFTKEEMEALLSRASNNTKIWILGDPSQVVNPCCSEDRNGLTSSIKHFLPSQHSFLFNLTVNNRNPISRLTSSYH